MCEPPLEVVDANTVLVITSLINKTKYCSFLGKLQRRVFITIVHGGDGYAAVGLVII
jgi:hypothetical protein